MNAPPETGKTTHVLVIDDETEIGELIAAAAENVGLSCIALTSARDLPNVIGPETTAVIIDLMMPDMDGIEVLRLLAQRCCKATVVLMSGFDRSVLRSAETLARAIGLRTAGPLHKPFRLIDAELLLEHVAGLPQPAHVAPAVSHHGHTICENELRAAIAEDRVEVHYQPQVELVSGRTVGIEALARLRDSRAALVMPDRFIELAEKTGLIGSLTDAVLKHSLQAIARCEHLAEAALSVNLSPMLLNDLDLPERVICMAEASGMALSRLTLEITESGLIREVGIALDILSRLRLRGIGLSIDDFGTGYASMAQLRRIPCTELKIDRMFVEGMLKDAADMVMVEETVELAHRLKLKVVAEGVETEAQAAALAFIGCDIGQGYYHARPMPFEALLGWLAKA